MEGGAGWAEARLGYVETPCHSHQFVIDIACRGLGGRNPDQVPVNGQTRFTPNFFF